MDQHLVEKIKEMIGFLPLNSDEWASSISLYSHLLRSSDNTLQHLPFESLKRITKTSLSDENFFALLLLFSSKTNFIELCHEIINDDDTCNDIDYETIIAARETNILYHPETGNVVNDFKNKIFIYFKITNNLSFFKKENEKYILKSKDL